jgi:predicted DNA-binding transcriptional regulator AlpA
MALHDPFPNTELLTSGQVGTIMGMKRTAWTEYLENNPAFPKAVVIGKTKNGREIRRFRKSDVFAFIHLRTP